MKENIMIFNPTINQIGLDKLKEKFNIFQCPDSSEATIIEYVNKNNIQVIVTLLEKITDKIFKNCPSLKLIGQHGVGVNHIDINSATENKVVVVNVPDSNHVSVAEHTMMSFLALSRNLLISDKETRKGNWNYRNNFMPTELASKVLLIIGLGMIGQELAKRAKIFQLEIISFDPGVSTETMSSYGVKKVSNLEEGLAQADFISLHVPLTPKTKNLITKKELGIMKKSAYLVNVARGSIINENDLYEALKKREISGVALDVLGKEPPPKDHPLFELENIIFTPHLAGDTLEAKNRCAIYLADDIIKSFNDELPKNLVNFKVLKKSRLF